MKVQLFAEHNRTPEIPRDKVRVLVRQIVRDEGKKADIISVVFVDDDFLLGLNKKFLNHHHKTDVIAFELGGPDRIEGEIYISVERAAAQARRFEVSLEREVLRLLIHGVLHLTGWEDGTRSQKLRMRKRENEFIERFYARTIKA